MTASGFMDYSMYHDEFFGAASEHDKSWDYGLTKSNGW
jgi:hypothetical protein